MNYLIYNMKSLYVLHKKLIIPSEKILKYKNMYFWKNLFERWKRVRKAGLSVDEIINKIKEMKGKDVSFEVNRGRNKTTKLFGAIENIYPSIFTIRLSENGKSVSYSYAEVLCGNVSFEEIEQ